MTDLITRLRAHAALHAGLPDTEQQQWGNDLREAAERLAAPPACMGDDCAELASLKDSYAQLLAENTKLRAAQPAQEPESAHPVAPVAESLIPASWQERSRRQCGVDDFEWGPWEHITQERFEKLYGILKSMQFRVLYAKGKT